MKVAITGYKGLIGSELIKQGCVPLECDVTSKVEVDHEINAVVPDVIIHCAALTDVNECENNSKKAFNINVKGTTNILDIFDGKFIFLSTVHVFNGKKYWPYSEKHKPEPTNVYGFSKWAGEVVTLYYGSENGIVIRTSKVFDYNYLKPTLETLKMGAALDFPTFITRSFVHVEHFVHGLLALVNKPNMPNIINIAGTETLNYHQFWLVVASSFEISADLIIPRKERIDLAPRPFRGGLDVGLAKKLGIPLYSVYAGLELIKERMK